MPPFQTTLDQSVGYYERGRDHFERLEFDAARCDFEKALELNPQNVPALTSLAAVLVNSGHPEDALPFVDAALRLDPDYARAHMNRGVILGRKGQVVEAIEECTAAIRRDPGFGLAYLNRGHLLAEIGKLEEALADYDAAIPFVPTNVSLWRERGMLLTRMRRHDEAVTDYAEALRLAPDSADIYIERVSIFFSQGRFPHALSDCEEALRIEPQNISALHWRALVRQRLGGRGAAMTDYNTALQLAPDRADIYLARGMLFHEMQDLVRAEVDYTEALQLDPKLAIAYCNRGDIRFYHEHPHEAIADFSEAVRLAPNYAAAYLSRGNAYRHIGRLQDAIADYTEALRLDPTQQAALNSRGEARLELGAHKKEAHDDIRAAARLWFAERYRGKFRSFKRYVLSWSAVIAVALLVLHVTLSPTLATIVVCSKFALDDIFTAVWVRRRDPWPARGRACSWFCVSLGILRVLGAALAGCFLLTFLVLPVLVFIFNVPPAAQGPVWSIVEAITATFGIGLPLQFLVVAGGAAIARRAGVQIWLDRELSVARRNDAWPPTCDALSWADERSLTNNRINLLLVVLVFELFLSGGLSAVGFISWLVWGNAMGPELPISAGIAAVLALTLWTMKPAIAPSPYECWYSPH